MFSIADDILVVAHESNEAHHDTMICKVLQICRKENLKLNKDKYHFRCTLVSFFGEIISSQEVTPDQRN